MKKLFFAIITLISINQYAQITCQDLTGSTVAIPFNLNGENSGIKSVDIYDDCIYEESLVNELIDTSIMPNLTKAVGENQFMLLCLTHAASYSMFTYVYKDNENNMQSKNGVLLLDDMSIEVREEANCTAE